MNARKEAACMLWRDICQSVAPWLGHYDRLNPPLVALLDAVRKAGPATGNLIIRSLIQEEFGPPELRADGSFEGAAETALWRLHAYLQNCGALPMEADPPSAVPLMRRRDGGIFYDFGL